MSVVYVVHCVDTEGPLGGDARRLPDGSPEFFDDWQDIERSLAELLDPDVRAALADSRGEPYRYSWFILDFTGFRTNPKQRVAEYHDTYDHLAALPTEQDGLYWHYHAPPADGIGDRWAESWLDSNEHNVILARRLLERRTFPVAFRAGGTIEDDAASRWLERVVPVDFSNRVSERSAPGADLFHFNWYGAPEIWGSYHPAERSFLEIGSMRRYVYRSIDLRSRYNALDASAIQRVFATVAESNEPCVLSYFSHDNRDMRPETYDVVEALQAASSVTDVPWWSCTADEAHRLLHRLSADPVAGTLTRDEGAIRVRAEREVFAEPFLAAQLRDGRFVRLVPRPESPLEWSASVDGDVVARVGAALVSEGAVATTVFA